MVREPGAWPHSSRGEGNCSIRSPNADIVALDFRAFADAFTAR